MDDGEGGVGGGKDKVPLPLGYPQLLGDAIVMMVLFGDGVALKDPGSEAGEITCRVNPACAFMATASTLAGLVGKSLIVF